MRISELMLGYIFEHDDEVYIVINTSDVGITAYSVYIQELVTFDNETVIDYLGRLDKVIESCGM